MHHASFRLRSILFFSLLISACDGNDAGTTINGTGSYRDASTNPDGTAHAADQPAAADVSVSLVVRGTGQMKGLDASCLDGTSGQFRALYAGTTRLGDGGAVTASLDAAAAITTPSGCTVPDLSVAAVTGVTVRAELAATTTSCESYCAASARADAEAQCAGKADQVTCRTQAETSASASCRTTCTQQAHVIVAETSLAATLLGSVDADQLRAGAFGDLHADLRFDHMEDASGHAVH
jgi:hypothetical protein